MNRICMIVQGCAVALPLLFAFGGGAGTADAKTLYTFCSKATCADGSAPYAGLIADAQGNFYGTTQTGGANGFGTVFKLTPDGKETVLYSFCSVTDQDGDCLDGQQPEAALVADAQGNLYGTTYTGGAQGAGGTVFKVTPQGQETVLHSFCSQLDESGACTDGANLVAGLVMDAQGNLYGTTYGGGVQNKGTVFEITPAGLHTVLYSFCALALCGDGDYPAAGLIVDAQGNLYGTTTWGGAGGCTFSTYTGCGTIFEVTQQGTEKVLYSFLGGNDGQFPSAAVMADAQGNLYGTTVYGGSDACLGTPANGCGTVFELTAQGVEAPLHSFQGLSDGQNPYAGLIADGPGNHYGTAGSGQVFEVTPQGNLTVLAALAWDTKSGLIEDAQGNFLGTTEFGGNQYNAGTVFKVRKPFKLAHP